MSIFRQWWQTQEKHMWLGSSYTQTHTPTSSALGPWQTLEPGHEAQGTRTQLHGLFVGGCLSAELACASSLRVTAKKLCHNPAGSSANSKGQQRTEETANPSQQDGDTETKTKPKQPPRDTWEPPERMCKAGSLLAAAHQESRETTAWRGQAQSSEHGLRGKEGKCIIQSVRAVDQKVLGAFPWEGWVLIPGTGNQEEISSIKHFWG